MLQYNIYLLCLVWHRMLLSDTLFTLQFTWRQMKDRMISRNDKSGKKPAKWIIVACFSLLTRYKLKFIFETFYCTSNRYGDKQSKVSEYFTLNHVALREFCNFKLGVANYDTKTFHRNHVNQFKEPRHTCVRFIRRYVKFVVDPTLLSNITN
jgi:hypothetical protein